MTITFVFVFAICNNLLLLKLNKFTTNVLIQYNSASLKTKTKKKQQLLNKAMIACMVGRLDFLILSLHDSVSC